MLLFLFLLIDESDGQLYELKRPEEVQDFEEAEDQLYIQCYDTSKKYHSMGLGENTIRLVLSNKGIDN